MNDLSCLSPQIKPSRCDDRDRAEGDTDIRNLALHIILFNNPSSTQQRQPRPCSPPAVNEHTMLLDNEEVDVSNSTVAPPEVVQSKVVGEWLLNCVISALICFLAFKLLSPWVVVASIVVFRLFILYSESSVENDGDLGERSLLSS